MTVIKSGAFDQIGVSFDRPSRSGLAPRIALPGLPSVMPLGAVPELSRSVDPGPIRLAESSGPWRLTLEEIVLEKSFEAFLPELFSLRNEVYFACLAWDYSGSPPVIFPARGAAPIDHLIPIGVGGARTLAATELPLWPDSVVTGALNLAMLAFEGTNDGALLARRLGVLHEQVIKSRFSRILAAVPQCPFLVMGSAVEQALGEMVAGIVEDMAREGDRCVVLLETTWGTHAPLPEPRLRFDHEAAKLALSLRRRSEAGEKRCPSIRAAEEDAAYQAEPPEAGNSASERAGEDSG